MGPREAGIGEEEEGVWARVREGQVAGDGSERVHGKEETEGEGGRQWRRGGLWR